MPSQAVCCPLIIRQMAQPACELVHTQFNSILFKRLAAVTRRSPASEEGEDQAAERQSHRDLSRRLAGAV